VIGRNDGRFDPLRVPGDVLGGCNSRLSVFWQMKPVDYTGQYGQCTDTVNAPRRLFWPAINTNTLCYSLLVGKRLALVIQFILMDSGGPAD